MPKINMSGSINIGDKETHLALPAYQLQMSSLAVNTCTA